MSLFAPFIGVVRSNATEQQLESALWGPSTVDMFGWKWYIKAIAVE